MESEFVTSKGKVLVVDDTADNVTHLTALLENEGYQVESASDGSMGLTKVETFSPDVVLLDINMPIMDGLEVCRTLRGRVETQLLPIVFITGMDDRATRITCKEAGCNDFLGKPVDAVELFARTRSLVDLKHLTDQMETTETVLRTLAHTLEAKDAYTQGHSERVADYTSRLAATVGLSVQDQERLHGAGLLHDIGKVAVRESVLHKPAPLTNEEFEHIKQHPIMGEYILRDLKFAHSYLPAIRHHHERMDGKGYPDGLSGEAIPMDAALMAIADAYDAMTWHRPYRLAMPKDKALAIIVENQGPQWHPEFTRAFVAMMNNGKS